MTLSRLASLPFLLAFWTTTVSAERAVTIVHEGQRYEVSAIDGDVWIEMPCASERAGRTCFHKWIQPSVMIARRLPLKATITDVFELKNELWALTDQQDLLRVQVDFRAHYIALAATFFAAQTVLPYAGLLGAFHYLVQGQAALAASVAVTAGAANAILTQRNYANAGLKARAKVTSTRKSPFRVDRVLRTEDGRVEDVHFVKNGVPFGYLSDPTLFPSSCGPLLEFTYSR